MRFGPRPLLMHLVLDAKQIPYHTTNINITNKPEWLFEANPLGKVPCLQLVDKPGAPFVFESLLIAEYLDELHPEPKLFPTDPLENLQEKLWIERFTSVAIKFNNAFVCTDTESALDFWNEALNLLDPFESELKKRGTKYFGGDEHANILDYAIWPYYQRFEVVQELFGGELSSERFPALVESAAMPSENNIDGT